MSTTGLEKVLNLLTEIGLTKVLEYDPSLINLVIV